MIVDILPFRLQLASLDKSDIPRCTHQLMKLILFPSRPRHFFSYAETDKEVSLILDQSYVSGFPDGALNTCNVVWRALQIEPGDSGLGSDEVISRVSKPLADNNISIMQISTYDADFTLLPECDIKKALECLRRTISISNNPFEESNIQVSDLNSWEKAYPESPCGVTSLHDALLLDPTARERKQSLVNGNELSVPKFPTLSINEIGERPPDQTGSQPMKPRHPFVTNYPHRLHIASMEESLMDMLAIKLLESIFFDQRKERFFSFTRTDNSLSLIMDSLTMSLFPEHTLNTHEGDWRLISIGYGPLGFDECGIVSEFSRPLCDNKISLFYLSTFSSDYIMVNDEDFEQAVSCLCETAGVIHKDVKTNGSCHGGKGDIRHKEVNPTEDLFTSGSESQQGSESECDSESLSEVDPEEEDESNGKGGGGDFYFSK